MRIVLTMVGIALGIAIAIVGSVYAWQRQDTAKQGIVSLAPVAVSTSGSSSPTDVHGMTGNENMPSLSSDSQLPTPSPETPLIFIRQFPDYTTLGREFPGGLVAALWPDGRMIRPTTREAVGDSYEEGIVSSSDLQRFVALLDARKSYTAIGPIVDAASQVIRVRHDSKTWEWSRGLPDPSSPLAEIEQQLVQLPITSVHHVSREAIDNSVWYKL